MDKKEEKIRDLVDQLKKMGEIRAIKDMPEEPVYSVVAEKILDEICPIVETSYKK